MKTVFTQAGKLIRFAVDSSYRARRRRWKTYHELFRSVDEGVLRISAPQFAGTFEMDCRSDLLKRMLIEGEHEPEIVDLLKRSIDPNRDAIDVGANVGFFTVLMAKLVSSERKVLAIEPTPGARGHLLANIERNDCRNVVVFGGVAAEHSGEFQINVIPGKEEYSSLRTLVHPSVEGRRGAQISVQGKTIDELVDEFTLSPGLIKIDAEGVEYRVLSGAEKTMKVHRPTILCEVWSDEQLSAAGSTANAFGELLASRGYAYRRCATNEVLAWPAA